MTEADLKGNFDDISLASQGIGEIVRRLQRPWRPLVESPETSSLGVQSTKFVRSKRCHDNVVSYWYLWQ